jgi:chemotaxis protein MotA
MDTSLWIGFISIISLVAWAISKAGFTISSTDIYGVILVIGGLVGSMMVNCSISDLSSALRRFVSLFLPSRIPTPDAAIEQIAILSRKAQKEGGILALQSEEIDFANGFLKRAILVAVSTGESAETRRVMETHIRRLRLVRQEDANTFRTMGVLAPMFGLLGTLLGMVRVLQAMSDPLKAAAGMALALSSAFIGITIANAVCVPIAGKIRLNAMRETMVLDLLLEGVLDIAAGKPPYLIELHLSSYSDRRQTEAVAPIANPAGNPQ